MTAGRKPTKTPDYTSGCSSSGETAISLESFRQEEVMTHLANGLSVKECAQRMDLSQSRVENDT